MRMVATLLFCLITCPIPLHGETNDPKDEKIHLAVQALVDWAEVAKDTGRSLRNSFIQPDDLELIREMRRAEVGFEQEFANFIDSQKKELTFEETPDDPSRGLIMSGEMPLLPARKTEARWKFDSETAEKMVLQIRIEIAKTNLQAFISGLENYKNLGGSYPTNEQGLGSLLERPDQGPRPRRWVQIVKSRQALLDPWGKPYLYQLKDGKPHLTSLGPDRKASEDDITSE